MSFSTSHPSTNLPPKSPSFATLVFSAGQLGHDDQSNVGDAVNELGDALPAIHLNASVRQAAWQLAMM